MKRSILPSIPLSALLRLRSAAPAITCAAAC